MNEVLNAGIVRLAHLTRAEEKAAREYESTRGQAAALREKLEATYGAEKVAEAIRDYRSEDYLR